MRRAKVLAHSFVGKLKVKVLLCGISTGRSKAGCAEAIDGFDNNKSFKGKGDFIKVASDRTRMLKSFFYI